MRIRPSTFVSMTVASSSSFDSQNGIAAEASPALLTRMSKPAELGHAPARRTVRELAAVGDVEVEGEETVAIGKTVDPPCADRDPRARLSERVRTSPRRSRSRRL